MQPNATKFTTNKEKILLSGVYNDLTKFAEDTDSHLIGDELEDSLKISIGRHYSLQALSHKINYRYPSLKQKLLEIPKNNRPTKRPMAGHKGIP